MSTGTSVPKPQRYLKPELWDEAWQSKALVKNSCSHADGCSAAEVSRQLRRCLQSAFTYTIFCWSEISRSAAQRRCHSELFGTATFVKSVIIMIRAEDCRAVSVPSMAALNCLTTLGCLRDD
eukprot:2432287-Amphidinium_carterae.1